MAQASDGVWLGAAPARFALLPGKVEFRGTGTAPGWIVRAVPWPTPKPGPDGVVRPLPLRRRSIGGALDALLELGRSGPGDNGARLREFIRRFGALPVCGHGEPLPHRRIDAGTGRTCECSLLELQPPALYEQAADRYEALIEISDSLWRQEVSEAELWSRTTKPGQRLAKPVSLEAARQVANAVMGLVIQEAGVGVAVTWDRAGANLLIGSSTQTLFAALALELMYKVLQIPAFTVCAGCGRPINLRARGRRRGERQWCGHVDCEKERKRVKMREHRARRQRGRKPVKKR